jgi:sec-independent protein translocase protein TatA
MLGRLGWLEILVIVLLLIILFGHSKIPNMMRNLASGITTFKKEMKKGDTKDAKKNVDTAPKKQTKARTKKVAKK